MRLRLAGLRKRWPAWLLVITWSILLACFPWWAGLPLLLGCAAVQIARLASSQRYNAWIRRALRGGFVGLLIAVYRVFDGYALALTWTLLAALVGFSLLVLLESWQDRKPKRSVTAAASTPEWAEMALAPIGPSGTLIELQSPRWLAVTDCPAGWNMTMTAWHTCSLENGTHIENVKPEVSVAPDERWAAWPSRARRGVVLYDRKLGRQYRLRGWHLYGWHTDGPWLTRSEDQPPLALSHVLGQDLLEE